MAQREILKNCKSESKHFVRSHDKNVENAIFRTRDEGTSILGGRYNAGNSLTAGARKEGSFYVVYGHQKCNCTLGE